MLPGIWIYDVDRDLGLQDADRLVGAVGFDHREAAVAQVGRREVAHQHVVFHDEDCWRRRRNRLPRTIARRVHRADNATSALLFRDASWPLGASAVVMHHRVGERHA